MLKHRPHLNLSAALLALGAVVSVSQVLAAPPPASGLSVIAGAPSTTTTQPTATATPTATKPSASNTPAAANSASAPATATAPAPATPVATPAPVAATPSKNAPAPATPPGTTPAVSNAASASTTTTAPAATAPQAEKSAAPVAIAQEDEIKITPDLVERMRDPFKRIGIAVQVTTAEIPPLERYDIGDFTLVGIITGANKNKALVTDKSGKMHVVTEKMRIGTRSGIIKKISPSSIFVEEKGVDVFGREEKLMSKIEFKEQQQSQSR